jgi:hypothetical protein
MSAQDDRIDREMLKSMAASFASGLSFSFNPQDMAGLLSRAAERIDPKPRTDLSAAREAAARLEGWNAAIEAAAKLAHGYGMKSLLAEHKPYRIAADIRAMKETE